MRPGAKPHHQQQDERIVHPVESRNRALYLYPKTRDRYCRSWKLVQPTAQGVRYFTAAFKVKIVDFRFLGVTNGNIWGVQDLDTRHIDNIIYLPRELLGRYVSRRTFYERGLVLMVTYSDLFQFVIMLCAVITLVIYLTRKK